MLRRRHAGRSPGTKGHISPPSSSSLFRPPPQLVQAERAYPAWLALPFPSRARPGACLPRAPLPFPPAGMPSRSAGGSSREADVRWGGRGRRPAEYRRLRRGVRESRGLVPCGWKGVTPWAVNAWPPLCACSRRQAARTGPACRLGAKLEFGRDAEAGEEGFPKPLQPPQKGFSPGGSACGKASAILSQNCVI